MRQLALLVIVFLLVIKSQIMSNYPKSTPTHSEPPKYTSPKNSNTIPIQFLKIPKEFPNSQRIPKFPKNSQRMPEKFPKNFQRISKEFPKNSQIFPKYPSIPNSRLEYEIPFVLVIHNAISVRILSNYYKNKMRELDVCKWQMQRKKISVIQSET